MLIHALRLNPAQGEEQSAIVLRSYQWKIYLKKKKVTKKNLIGNKYLNVGFKGCIVSVH